MHHSKNMPGLSFLVTGGAGFIGSHIVGYLLLKGAGKVRVLDNYSTGSPASIVAFKKNSSFEMIEGDVCDPDTCKRAVEGIDYVIHLAALVSVQFSIDDPIKTNAVNITGFLNVLVAACDAKVKRMVYASGGAENTTMSPYTVTKYVNELYAGVFSRTYDFQTIGIRYNSEDAAFVENMVQANVQALFASIDHHEIITVSGAISNSGSH